MCMAIYERSHRNYNPGRGPGVAAAARPRPMWPVASQSAIADWSALPVEVTLLRGVGRVPGGHLVGGGRRGGVAVHFEQVRADRVEPVVAGERPGEFVGRG